jgi:UDP-N-acetylmuramyl pentapeptide phosphotransferase/UDP-N-acetylglucosamine-1-phosphate transferase
VFYLISAVLGGAFGVGWVAVTGDNDIPYLVIIGYCLAVSLLSELAEGAMKRRRIRRSRPRRAHAQPRPTKPRKAA